MPAYAECGTPQAEIVTGSLDERMGVDRGRTTICKDYAQLHELKSNHFYR